MFTSRFARPTLPRGSWQREAGQRTEGARRVAGWTLIATRWRDAWAVWRTPRSLGERGERRAERHLRRLGYRIVARRSRNRYGEHDLIAVEGRTVVFVEVKTRRRSDVGRPAEAVDRTRQQRLVRAAAAFMKRRNLQGFPARFDVVEVVWPDGEPPRITHFRGAFRADGPFHFGR